MGEDKRAVGGRVVRVLTKPSGDGPLLEQFFLVGIDNHWKAKEAVSASQETAYGTIQIIGKILPKMAANLGLRDYEVRRIVPE
jgi:hypothetical protein